MYLVATAFWKAMVIAQIPSKSSRRHAFLPIWYIMTPCTFLEQLTKPLVHLPLADMCSDMHSRCLRCCSRALLCLSTPCSLPICVCDCSSQMDVDREIRCAIVRVAISWGGLCVQRSKSMLGNTFVSVLRQTNQFISRTYNKLLVHFCRSREQQLKHANKRSGTFKGKSSPRWSLQAPEFPSVRDCIFSHI